MYVINTCFKKKGVYHMSKKKGSFIKFSLAAAGLFHAVNRWIDSTATAKQSSSSNGKFYHWSQGDIFYKKISEKGAPLLLIHELSPFNASFEWNEIVDALKDEFTVYVMDLPGCGKSEKPAITYTNYYFVQAVSDFIHDVICEPTYVISTGLSGSFVLMADQLYPNLFQHMIWINPDSIEHLKMQPDYRSKIIQKLLDFPLLGTTAYYTITNHFNTEYHWTDQQTFNPFCIDQRFLKASYDASHAGNGAGKYLLGSADGHYLNVNISKALASVSTPIHLVFGEHIPNYHEIINEYRKLNTNITAEIISDCKMYPQIETPEDLVESIYTYLGSEA